SFFIGWIFELNFFLFLLAFSNSIYYTKFCRKIIFYNPLLIIYTPLKRPMAPPSVFSFLFAVSTFQYPHSNPDSRCQRTDIHRRLNQAVTAFPEVFLWIRHTALPSEASRINLESYP